MKKALTIILPLAFISLGVILCEFAAQSIGLGKPIIYEVDKLVGYRPRPNQKTKRLKGAEITIDQEGFRVPPINRVESSKKGLLFVGDSVTYGGSYIDDAQLFSSKVCSKYRYITCLNGGVNGWGTANMGRFISNLSLYTNKELERIFLVILPGDDGRNLALIRGLPFWTNTPRFPSAIYEVLRFTLYRNIIPSLSRQVSNKKLLVSNFELRNKVARDVHWEELRGHLLKSQTPISIIVSPPKSWLQNKKQSSSEVDFYRKQLQRTSELQVVDSTCNLIDYLPNLQNSQDWYVDAVHLSVKGHSAWAEAITSCIKL